MASKVSPGDISLHEESLTVSLFDKEMAPILVYVVKRQQDAEEFSASLERRNWLPKNKDKDVLEFHRGKIRELQKEVRHLQKRVKELEKYERAQDEEITKDQGDTYADLPKLTRCQSDSCSKGYYVEIELAGKTYGTCTICNDRRRIK